MEKIGEEDMRNPRKRLLTLITSIILVLTLTTAVSAASTENCPGSCTHAAAIGTTHYDTLAEAFTAATDGCTVTVLCDIADSAPLTLDKAITLNLGGKTVTGLHSEDYALLTTTKDLTVTGGTLATNKGVVLLATDCAVTVDKTAALQGGDNAVALLLQSFNAETAANISGKLANSADAPALGAVAGGKDILLTVGQDASITAANSNAIAFYGCGKLEITGGEISAKECAVEMDVFDEKTIEASITGGKFTVEGEKTLEITSGTDATAPKDFVIGGTYNKLPTEYIPDYCRITDNGDGTYTVTAEYAITFAANGASGSMTAAKADRGSRITLPTCSFTAPAGKHFKAWDIGGTEYAPGASFAVNGPVSLTALWADHTGGSASCTAKAVCSVCGSSYGDYISHNLSQVSAYAATCTHSGMNSHSKCVSCGQLFVSGIPIRASSLTIPALGHRMSTVTGKEATCTEDGIAAYEKCDFCGLLQMDGKAVSQEDLVIPAAGHELSTIPAVEATCTQPGTLAHEVCARCGEISLKGQAVEAEALVTEVSAHILSDWQSDAATHWKACTECGEVFRQHSHKDSDGDEACDDCAYAMPAPTEMIPVQEEDTVSFPFLIPVIVAVVIAVGGAVMVASKKKKQ